MRGLGMLERARATALVLLGATTAVGLAIVAIAANQGWPLVAGSSIPPVPKEDVGKASVVARPTPVVAPHASAGHRSVGASVGHAGADAGEPGRSAAEPVTSSGGEETAALVVSEQAPARSPDAASPATPPRKGKAPTSPSSPTSQQPAAPTSSPTPQPATTPAPPPAQPEAVVSEAPTDESNVPSWSSGHGHAYGRAESWHDEGEGEDDGYDDDHGWDHSGDGHGHGYGYGD